MRQYRATANHLGAVLGTTPGTVITLEIELDICNSRVFVGLSAGAIGEISEAAHGIPSSIASENLRFFALNPGMETLIFLRRLLRLGLEADRGWAKLLLECTRDLDKYPNKPRNARSTDEDGPEAHAPNNRTETPGKNGG